MRNKLILLVVSLLLLPLAFLLWLGSSERGLQWAYQQVLPALPAELAIGELSGRLIGPVTMSDLSYRDDSANVHLERLTFDWDVAGLLSGRLLFSSIKSNGLRVELQPRDEVVAAETKFPEIRLPLVVQIDQFKLRDVTFDNNDSVISFERIESRLLLDQQQLEIDTLVYQSEARWLKLAGSVYLDAGLAHDLTIGWQSPLAAYGEFSGSGQLTGSLAETSLQHRLSGPLQANLDLIVEQPLGDFKWQGSLQLVDFDSTLINSDLPRSKGSIQISAEGDRYRATGSGKLDLSESPYGPVTADFQVAEIRPDWQASAVSVDRLMVRHRDNAVLTSGALQYGSGLDWQAELSTTAFNPAVYQSNWPGSINAAVSVTGSVREAGPMVEIDIKRFSGELRDYPVTVAGQATWQGDSGSLRNVQLASGETRVTLDGSIADQLALQWSVASDNLDELMPETAGAIQAKGRLDGELQRPTLSGSLSATDIRYQDVSVQAVDGSARLVLDPQQLLLIDFSQAELDFDLENIVLEKQSLQRVVLRKDGRQMSAQLKAAEIAANVEFNGELNGEVWRGSLRQASLEHVEYGKWSLQAPAAVTLSADAVELAELCLDNPRTGDLCLQVNASGSASELIFDLQNLPLALMNPLFPASVAADGLANASGTLNYDGQKTLLGEVAISLPRGQFLQTPDAGNRRKFAYESATIQSQLKADGVSVTLEALLEDNGRIQGTAYLPGAALIDFDVNTQPLQGQLQAVIRQLDFVDEALPQVDKLKGRMEIALDLDGLLSRPLITGSAALLEASLTLPQIELPVSRINFETKIDRPNQFEHQLNAVIAGGSVVASGRTSLDNDAVWSSELSLRAEKLAMAKLLRARLPQDLQIEGPLDVTLQARLAAADRLSAELELQLPRGKIRYPLPENEQGDWLYRDGLIEVSIDEMGARVQAGLSVGDNRLRSALQLPGFKLLDVDPQSQVVKGDISIELSDLSLIELLVADIQRSSGRFDAQIMVDGTLANLKLDTAAKLQDAALELPSLGLNLQQINITADTAANGLTQLTGSLQSGEGQLLIDGQVDLLAQKGWPGKVTLKGENVEILKTPEARINASPDIRIEFENRNIFVFGEVFIPYARIQPSDMSTAVRVSRDAVVLGEEKAQQNAWNFESQVRITLGERVDFYGYGFECQLAGSLLVEESPGQPTRGTGEIRIIEGRYRAYGQFLNIDDGKLLFSGGPLVNPGLDMRAVRQTNGVLAGVNVSGRLRAPRIDLFSEPAMGQADTLSYLLTGGPLETATRGEGATMASAALALGLTGGDRIARSLGDRFGIDEMRIENSSTGDQASLVMGRYLSPRLYIGYGVGLIESVNTINLRYSITKSWKLEAESGENQGVDLIFGFER